MSETDIGGNGKSIKEVKPPWLVYPSNSPNIAMMLALSAPEKQ